MALNCGISNGIDVNCDDLRKPGGVARDVWAFNLQDLRIPIDVTIADYVKDLEFNTYKSLYKISGTKFSHQATWTENTSDGGAKSYSQEVNIRAFNNDPDDDKVIEDLGVAEVGVITKTNAGEFLIWGAQNGLSSDGSTGGTGRQATDATTAQIILKGVESYLPKRLLIGGSNAATQAYIDAMTS